MFINKRTGAKAKELRGYDSEEEADAKRRLEAAGWQFGGVDFNFDTQSKKFILDDGPKSPLLATSKPEGEGDD